MRPWSCVLCSPLVLALCLLWVRAPPAGQQAVFTRVRGGPLWLGSSRVWRGALRRPLLLSALPPWGTSLPSALSLTGSSTMEQMCVH